MPLFKEERVVKPNGMISFETRELQNPLYLVTNGHAANNDTSQLVIGNLFESRKEAEDYMKSRYRDSSSRAYCLTVNIEKVERVHIDINYEEI